MSADPAAALRLRPFRPEDEAAARAAHAAMTKEAFRFLLDYDVNEPWRTWIDRREANRRGDGLPDGPGWVASSFLAASVEGELVGRVSVRHALNDWLANFGGHIGYGVVPWARRRGYGSEILRQALICARAIGIDDVLLLCDVNNAASARTIEGCGGRFESVITDRASGTSARRYWIH